MALALCACKSDNQTMKTYRPSRAPCPVGRAARLLGDRWVLLILRDAFLGAERFEEFVDRLGINRAALTSRLAILQEAGLMLRDPPEGKRARYVLTDKARALVPTFTELAGWSSAHLFSEGERPDGWPQAATDSSRSRSARP
jgi:DNA-binding HxlR family transcriptional regulator